jgi:hypothetical protein
MWYFIFVWRIEIRNKCVSVHEHIGVKRKKAEMKPAMPMM